MAVSVPARGPAGLGSGPEFTVAGVQLDVVSTNVGTDWRPRPHVPKTEFHSSVCALGGRRALRHLPAFIWGRLLGTMAPLWGFCCPLCCGLEHSWSQLWSGDYDPCHHQFSSKTAAQVQDKTSVEPSCTVPHLRIHSSLGCLCCLWLGARCSCEPVRCSSPDRRAGWRLRVWRWGPGCESTGRPRSRAVALLDRAHQLGQKGCSPALPCQAGSSHTLHWLYQGPGQCSDFKDNADFCEEL